MASGSKCQLRAGGRLCMDQRPRVARLADGKRVHPGRVASALATWNRKRAGETIAASALHLRKIKKQASGAEFASGGRICTCVPAVSAAAVASGDGRYCTSLHRLKAFGGAERFDIHLLSVSTRHMNGITSEQAPSRLPTRPAETDHQARIKTLPRDRAGAAPIGSSKPRPENLVTYCLVDGRGHKVIPWVWLNARKGTTTILQGPGPRALHGCGGGRRRRRPDWDA